jgi:hypothetical protein
MEYATFKDLAGPIATVIASCAAAFVAYRLGKSQIAVARTQADIAERNWQTANEKVVLDLLERRLAIYDGIRDVIGEVTRSGNAPHDVYYRFARAIDRVPFLFGPEVKTYVDGLAQHMNQLGLAYTTLDDPNCPDRGKWSQIRSDEFLAATKFYTESDAVFGPYLRAQQRID